LRLEELEKLRAKSRELGAWSLELRARTTVSRTRPLICTRKLGLALALALGLLLHICTI